MKQLSNQQATLMQKMGVYDITVRSFIWSFAAYFATIPIAIYAASQQTNNSKWILGITVVIAILEAMVGALFMRTSCQAYKTTASPYRYFIFGMPTSKKVRFIIGLSNVEVAVLCGAMVTLGGGWIIPCVILAAIKTHSVSSYYIGAIKSHSDLSKDSDEEIGKFLEQLDKESTSFDLSSVDISKTSIKLAELENGSIGLAIDIKEEKDEDDQ